jgi:hypothetical protein
MMQITFHFRTVGDRKWAFLVEQAVKRRRLMEQPLKPRKIGLVVLMTGQLVSEII